MRVPTAALGLALAPLAAVLAADESVTLGPCALSALSGPQSAAALISEDAEGDRLVTLNVQRCIVTGCSIDPSMLCAAPTGEDADAGVYFNAHSYVEARQDATFKLDAQAAQCTDAADCARLDASQLTLMNGQPASSPIWECVDDPEQCGGVLWHNNLAAPLTCPGGATDCWSRLGPDVSLAASQSVAANQSSMVASYTFPGTHYFKLARNIDVVDGHIPNSCTRLPAYQMSRDGMAVVQNECDALPGCIGFSLETPPNQAPFACFVDSFSRFDPVKTTKYSVKLFLREPRGPLRRFYGYAAYDRGTRAAGPELQTFTADSGYTAGDCASMCDSMGSCTGYAAEGDACRALYAESDRGQLQGGLGAQQFFRKKVDTNDALRGCETALDACAEGVDAGLVAGLVLLFLALGAGAFVVMRVRQRRLARAEDDGSWLAVTKSKIGSKFGSRVSSTASDHETRLSA